MKSNIKRVVALIGVIIIGVGIITTLALAIAGSPLFIYFLGGCILLPIVLWLAIWFTGLLTNKKTIASFRSAEMDETMRQADIIRDKLKEDAKGTGSDEEASNEKSGEASDKENE